MALSFGDHSVMERDRISPSKIDIIISSSVISIIVIITTISIIIII